MTKTASLIDKEILKKYGDIAIPASSLKEYRGKIIPTTLSLDIALKGGIVEGSTVSISGVTGSGKTTLILQIIANAQALGKKGYYFDIENRLQPELLQSIQGLDLEKLTIIRSTKGQFLTAEKILNLLESIASTEPDVVLVLDSVAMLCSEAAQQTEHGESKKMMAIPSLIYASLRKIAQYLPAMSSNLIMVTHIQANPSAYSGPTEVGGNAIKYQSSTRIMCLSSREVPETDKEKTGRESTFKIMKSALGPGTGSAEFYIDYGKGYNKEKDIFYRAEELGYIIKGGAWYSFDLPELAKMDKIQGQENVVNFLKTNKEVCDKLDQMIRDVAMDKKL